MSKSTSLRPRVAGRLQSSAEAAIKRPVKEAVREALADTAQNEAGNADPATDALGAESRRIEVDTSDVGDADESGSSTGDPTQPESGSRVRRRLKSRRTLALGLVALGAYLTRRRRSSTKDD
ncbi:hypothetical protein Harman_22410 [Haloarcula mannanilytica]|uniref:Uncharacterized protein n=1 Tax=Haloarcula mannanilytica TaxID=2509225 RepID=A0A4C2EIX0_9EURY|nr:hypothetical protein [Haloarcula mannanilytica]GCF14306.1 hypothetical protein Harman_22410 [Haloarcula mannanilytica]